MLSSPEKASSACRGGVGSDDEVALIHGLESPFRAVSEPLVHIRASLQHLRDSGALPEPRIEETLTCFKNRW
ncbi:TfuA-like protein [Streptomyces sp. NPDC002521]